MYSVTNNNDSQLSNPSPDDLTRSQQNYNHINQLSNFPNQIVKSRNDEQPNQPEVIDVDAEDTSPDITPLQYSRPSSGQHVTQDGQEMESFQPINKIITTSMQFHPREEQYQQNQDTGESQRKRLRLDTQNLQMIDSQNETTRRDDGTSIDSINSTLSSGLKNSQSIHPKPSRGQPTSIPDPIELNSDDDGSPVRPRNSSNVSYQLDLNQQTDQNNERPTSQTNPNTGSSRLVLSTGGGLFRMDDDNNIQILDSDDEDEMTSSHRIVNDDNGMIALETAVPTHPVPESQVYGDSLMQNPVAVQPGAILPPIDTGMLQTANLNGFPTSSQNNLRQNQAPADMSNIPWASDPALPPPNESHHHQQNFIPNEIGYQTEVPNNSQSRQMYPQLFNTALPMNSDITMNQTAYGTNDNTALHQQQAPQQAQLLARIDEVLGLRNQLPSPPPLPPDPIIFPIPPAVETENEVEDVTPVVVHAPADSVGEQGLSQNGLRNLLRQNELTADATVEAESPDELTVTLMPHQKRALAWMRKRELPTDTDEELIAVDDECLGGILADDQGLGKTLSMIALVMSSLREFSKEPVDSEETEDESDDEGILEKSDDDSSPERKPKQKNRRPQTLIVCPVSLINQWKDELRTRIKPRYRPSVTIYHGPKRTKRVRDLENYDIVITTYSILKNEYPKILTEHPEYHIRKDAKLRLPTREPGPPFKIEWDRVVIDEAQYIKNRKTGAWKAAMAIRSRRRWCLTGTPIQNSVDDIYSLFCFVRYQFVPSVEMWNTRWKRKLEHPSAHIRENAFRRFQTVTGVVLLRRTKKDEINGKPLIELPPRISKIMERAFHDEEEQKVYQAVQEKTVIQVNRFLLAGTLKTNYSSVLLLLLRLRQACSHPFLIQYTQLTGTRCLTAAGLLDSYESPYNADDLEEAMELIQSGYSIMENIEESNRERLEKLFEPVMKGKRHKKPVIKCDTCSEQPSRGEFVITRCGHLFCRNCRKQCAEVSQCRVCCNPLPDPEEEEPFYIGNDVQKEIHAKMILGDDSKQQKNVSAAEIRACMREDLKRRKRNCVIEKTTKDEPNSSSIKGESMILPISQDLDQKTEEKGSKSTNEAAKGRLKTKEDVLRAISQHSTKVRMVIDQLNDTRREDPSAKTIIFSQWTSMLDILDFHVQLNGHKLCRLDGSMQLAVRQRQLEEFKSNSEVSVMLISLHAGGTGLNLTEASNVILTDVWWNPSVEEQAIDRAHRIGQTKAVNVRRIKMTGTVEEKIYAICERKREIIDGSLGVTGAQSLGRKRLSVAELMEMFGSAAENVARNAEAGTAAAEAASNILRHSS